MRAFEAERTNAHRICTASDGWVERFGADVLVSFKSETARERLTTEYVLWADNVGFSLSRMFARFLPRRNAEREAPRLLLGDQEANLRTVVMETSLQYGIDFGAGYSVGLFVDQRENRRFVRQVDRFGNGARDKRLARRHHLEVRHRRNIAFAFGAAFVGAVKHRQVF